MEEFYSGTVLASPVVVGSTGDTYGTHHSVLGVGGYIEVDTLEIRNNIPVDTDNGLHYGGLSSGRRKYNMLVNVAEENTTYQLHIDYATWTGLTDTQKVNELADNSNWVEFKLGGSGERIEKIYSQTAHGFIAGEVLGYDHNSGEFEKVLAQQGEIEPLGIVDEVVNSNSFRLVFAGYVENTVSGYTDYTGNTLNDGTVYYLSDSVAGKLTSNEPTAIGSVSKPMLSVMGNNGLVFQYRGNVVTSGSTGDTSIEKIQRALVKTNHNFQVGEVVTYIGGTYVKAIADGSQSSEVMGLVTKIVDPDNFVVTYAGSVSGLGSLSLSASTTYYLSATVAGALTHIEPTISRPIIATTTGDRGVVLQYRSYTSELPQVSGTNIGDGDGLVFSGATNGVSRFRSLKASGSTSIQTFDDYILITSSGGTLGVAEDGDYTDGLFTDFTPDTPVGTFADRVNEVLKALAPTPPPDLDDLDGIDLTSAKLSFGINNNDIGYYVVNNTAGNGAIDINQIYQSSSNKRLGVTQNNVVLTLNEDIDGNLNGIGSPFEDAAFGKGNKGSLKVSLNGVTVNIVSLTATTTSINQTSGNTTLAISELKYAKLSNGAEFTSFPYRTGTLTINTAGMRNGFNYIRVTHEGTSFSTVTNYTEWVYDPDNTAITVTGEVLSIKSLAGSKHISGVHYHESGSFDYTATIGNAYKYVYSTSTSALEFVSRIKLNDGNLISMSGAGIVDRLTPSSSHALQALDETALLPQNTSFTFVGTLTSNSKVLGNTSSNGTVSTDLKVVHPFTSLNHNSGSAASLTGFLIYPTNQVSDDEEEDFLGEINRLYDFNYTIATYANVNGGVYGWDGTKSLVGADSTYNNGLLIFDGNLLYPNASYLNTTYGIVAGNFGAVTNSPAGNPNYSGAGGVRRFIRKFESNNGTTLSSLTFEIAHTGTQSNFLTNAGDGGTPSGNSIKLEFLIMRSNGEIYGWANPFASSGDVNGIANTSLTHSGGVTTVSCSLATTPRVGNGDIIIMRIKAASGWTNRITRLEITNI